MMARDINRNEIINGENDSTRASSPLKALMEFYAGFNQRDVQRSMQCWAKQDDVVMCNPIGGFRKGWDVISAAYQSIMEGNTHVYVEFYDYQLTECGDLFYVVGRERGYAKFLDSAGEQYLDLAIRTSRVFRKINNIWQQVHHHGSIDAPEALAQYQSLINRS